MDPALIVARLVGPVLAIVGIGMMANSAVYSHLGWQFLASYPIIYLSGVLVLLAGLIILNAHHGWTRDWRSLITAIGWLLTGIGTFRILASQLVSFIGKGILPHDAFFIGAGIVLFTLGGFITFKGYVA